jgi:hypothetical protein
VVNEHAAARCQGVHQGRHQIDRFLLVEDLVQDPAEHQADRLIAVKQFAGGAEDAFRIAQVAADRERPFVVGQQGDGVRDHHRVVVQVDHPDVRVEPLAYLMDVLHGGQAGADVQQLGHALVADHVADDAGEHLPLQLRARPGRGHGGDNPVALRPVDREVVPPAKQVVVHARGIGARCVDLGRLGHEKNSRPCHGDRE